MTDHDLNRKMAKLCGIEVVDHPLDSHGLPYMVDFGLEGEGFAMMVDVGGKAVKVVWNPVDNWQQVHEFVIPALNNLGLDVKLVMLHGWANDSQIWRDDVILQATSEGNDDSHCKVTCWAVLYAWEQLKELEAGR